VYEKQQGEKDKKIPRNLPLEEFVDLAVDIGKNEGFGGRKELNGDDGPVQTNGADKRVGQGDENGPDSAQQSLYMPMGRE
jgi:hypothetical protein